jgi:hypothetical protein
MTGANTILTGAEWVLRTVRNFDGQIVVFDAQCTTCKETSGHGSDVARSVGAWALGHTRANPEHRGYVSIARTRWRVDPNLDPPVADTASAKTETETPVLVDQGGDQLPRRPIHHARPRSSSTWVWRRITRFAGPLYVLGLCAAVCAFLFAVLVSQKSPQETRHPNTPVHNRTSWERTMTDQPKSCSHRRLTPKTRKCKDCGAQIYLPKKRVHTGSARQTGRGSVA